MRSAGHSCQRQIIALRDGDEASDAVSGKGREASVAIKVLSPYATDTDLYLRQGAMEGLAATGDDAVPLSRIIY